MPYDLIAKKEGALDALGVLGLTDYAIVSVTASTKTIVVTGDATGEIHDGDDISLTGTSSSDGNYTVDGTPTFSTPNTTIVVDQSPADDETTGNCYRTVVATGTDNVDVAGYWLTQGTSTGLGSLFDSVGGGKLTLDTGGTFTCPSVIDVPIIIPSDVTAVLDFGDPEVDGGCQYSLSGSAITCQSGGTVTDVTGGAENSGDGYGFSNYGTVTNCSWSLENSGSGYGFFNNETVTDFSGALVNTGAGIGFSSSGTVGDFGGPTHSGSLENTGAGYGFYNDGEDVTDFSGDLVNSGTGYGFFNSNGTVTDYSGTLTNTGEGVGFDNDAGVDDVSGTITGTAGTPWSGPGPSTGITGSITKAIPDLLAENIKSGKTILGVDGELVAGGGGVIIVEDD
jgi:hypothetical protein